METDESTKPLREWNRLARENTENAIVSSMFSATLRSTTSIESFSNWMLLATAAVASFLLVNSSNLIEFVGKESVVFGGFVLCASCIFGLLSKVFALRCKIAIDTSEAINATFKEHLAKYKEEEKKIQEGAEFWGINIETGIRIERVLTEFLAPFPWFVRWLANRQFKRHANNPQIGYLAQLRSLRVQGYSVFIQAILFIFFFAQSFLYATRI